MKRLIKTTAIASGAVMLSVLSAVGYYGRALPDTYNICRGEHLYVHSMLPITAVSTESTAAEVFGNAEGSGSTLMLFGAVPVKDVKTRSTERAYAAPGGVPIGLRVISDGVIVVDIQEVEGRSPAKEAGIRIGDVIYKVNGEAVSDNADVAEQISGSFGKPCEVQLERDGKKLTLEIEPELSEGSYKAGLWVRDSSAGIGTLTFYERSTGAFAGLGHAVCDCDTRQEIGLSSGTVGEIRLTGITRSESGSPGQLIGEFKNSASIGEIRENCSEGVYGTLNSDPVKNHAELPVAFPHEVREGAAVMLTSVDGSGAEEYRVEIEEVDLSDSAEHDMLIHVTDKRLIERAGGIVQGMSGSPLIQNGRIVGAVTHVLVDDSTRGYAIFADKMYSHLSDIDPEG